LNFLSSFISPPIFSDIYIKERKGVERKRKMGEEKMEGWTERREETRKEEREKEK
jgi:hypothetical protein